MKKSLWVMILLTCFSQGVFAETATSLTDKRTKVIKNYVKWLGKGNYRAIAHLFSQKGLAVSSSGIVDKPEHFFKTLLTETISEPKSILINTFVAKANNEMMTAYFYYSWKNKENHQVSAKFIDLFIFEKNSEKIKGLYVFSNTFQNDVMKQLG
jgi:hypothetical protein